MGEARVNRYNPHVAMLAPQSTNFYSSSLAPGSNDGHAEGTGPVARQEESEESGIEAISATRSFR
jgi:hypothetical protein